MPLIAPRRRGGVWSRATIPPGGATPRTYGPVPSEPYTPGQPWVRIGGRPAAGGAVPAGAGSNAPNPTGPYTGLNLPPLPGGQYNPEHDTLSYESQQGLGDTERDVETATKRNSEDYWTRLGRLRQSGTDEGSDYQRARDLLSQSFQRLATRQGEQQNAAGLLGGGAGLAAAQARARNQATQQGAADITHERNVRANEQAQGDLDRELAPETATYEGGRAAQDLATRLKRGQRNDVTFRTGQHNLATYEATAKGYDPNARVAVRKPSRKKAGRR